MKRKIVFAFPFTECTQSRIGRCSSDRGWVYIRNMKSRTPDDRERGERIQTLGNQLRELEGVETDSANERRKTIMQELIELTAGVPETITLRPKSDRRRTV